LLHKINVTLVMELYVIKPKNIKDQKKKKTKEYQEIKLICFVTFTYLQDPEKKKLKLKFP